MDRNSSSSPPAEDISRLFNRKRILRTQITNKCYRIDDLLLNEVLLPNQVDEVEALVDTLKMCCEQHAETLRILEPSFTLEQQEKELNSLDEYNVKVCSVMSKYTRHGSNPRHPSSGTSNLVSASGTTHPVASTSSNLPSQNLAFRGNDFTNLPKLEISKFDGQFHMWHAFWDEFRSTIHDDPRISSTTKHKYLRSLLIGEPLSLILSNELTDDGYTLSINQLKNDYGKPEFLISSHIKAIHYLASVDDAHDLTSLKNLESSLRKHISALEILKVNTDVFMPFIIDKLPQEIFQSFKDKYNGGQSVHQLLEHLKKRTSDLQEWFVNRQQIQSFQHRNTYAFIPPSAAVLNVNSSSQPAPSTKNFFCFICGVQGHSARVCNAGLTVQEKRGILISKGRCLRCFRLGHKEDACTFQLTNCRRCDLPHFQSLCPKLALSNKPTSTPSVPTSNKQSPIQISEKTSINTVNTKTNYAKEFLLNTAAIYVWNADKTFKIKTLCLIDNGSQRTFIKQSLIDQLNLKTVANETLTTGVFGGVESTKLYPRIKGIVSGAYTNSSMEIEALAVTNPSSHKISGQKEVMHGLVDYLLNLGFQSSNNYNTDSELDIGIIFGMDYYHKIMFAESIILGDGLKAQSSFFGWCISGQIEKHGSESLHIHNISCNTVSVVENVSQLDEQLKKLWTTEAVGITVEEEVSKSQFVSNFRKTTTFNNDTHRFSVALPWKTEMRQKLHSNFNAALQRLRSTIYQLSKSKELFENYAKTIEAYVSNDHAEEVRYQELKDVIHYGFHIAHQAVYSAHRSTKTRIVFDASSRTAGNLALNDCIEAGDDRGLDIVKMLHQFRKSKWALTGDIQKAFLQIELNEEDRDYVRFLWVDRSLPEEQWFEKPKIYRMKRVLFGVNASPELLKQTLHLLADKFEEKLPEVAQVLHNHIYVDDIITGADSEEALFNLKEGITKVLDYANLPMHKVRTNHEIDGLWNVGSADEISLSTTSVLGLSWDVKTDELIVKIPEKILLEPQKLTKRDIVSKASAVFDPLGWLAPLLIRARMIFQLMWLLQLEWDKLVTTEVELKWRKWLALVNKCMEWRIPRFIYRWGFQNGPFHNKLHVFCDASPRAYGAVAYIISRTSDGLRKSSILQSRFRVAPIKPLSIPRLELLAALLGARLAHYLVHIGNYDGEEVTCWSDSKIALHWITKWKVRSTTFVNNRVEEIRKLTSNMRWKYCPTSVNPADLATKDNDADPLAMHNMWWQGPKWLSEEDNPCEQDLQEDLFCEDEHESLFSTRVHTQTCTSTGAPDIANIMDIKRFSNYNRLLNAGAHVLSLFDIPVSRSKRSLVDRRIIIEHEWIKSAQMSYYGTEINSLISIGHVEPSSSLYKLHPTLDEFGLLRMKTRLNNGEFENDWACPIILPREHYLTHLIIWHIHRTNLHAGFSTTNLMLRQRFWVPRARTMIRNIVNNCLICSRFKDHHLSQPTPPLPPLRTNAAAPFVNVGLDYAGPIYVFEEKSIVKNYIALFSCAVTRAIHLELVPSLKAKDVILAIQRFCARRGTPSVIQSDNATYYKAAGTLLQSEFVITDGYLIQQFLSNKNIRWDYICEKAPWWGGYWERLIKSIKEPLRKVLGKTTLSSHHFNTLLCEVEALINSRPILVQYDDSNDWQPVTPAELCIGRRLSQLDQDYVQNVNIDLRDIAKIRNRFFTSFINAWKRAYLGQLRDLHVYDKVQESSVNVGDVVLVDDDSLHPHLWPLARINNVHVGKDGIIRSCDIITQDNKELTRPINLLVKLPGLNKTEVVSGPAGVLQIGHDNENENHVSNDVARRTGGNI